MIKYNKRKSTFMLYLGILCSISLIGTMTGCERQPKNVMNNNSIQEQTPPLLLTIFILRIQVAWLAIATLAMQMLLKP